MFRFFVQEKSSEGFILSKKVIKHIQVARITNKEFICIYQSKFYVCKLDNEIAKVIRVLDENHELKARVVLAAAIIDTKRFEWLIQKTTELGVSKIIPILSQNVSTKIFDLTKKLDRWNTIALNAAEQSFRNQVPVIELPMSFKEVVEEAVKMNCAHKFIAHEKAGELVPLESFPQDVIFLVGPEGGFTDAEVKLAEQHQFQTVSLGKRILRAETASMFLLSRVEQS